MFKNKRVRFLQMLILIYKGPSLQDKKPSRHSDNNPFEIVRETDEDIYNH